MPVYEYMCEECGPFTAMRPMAEYEKPCTCPSCALDAPRVLLTAPRCVTAMPRETRVAHATNEKNQHAPSTVAEYKAKHPSGCSCCSGRSLPKRAVARRKNGSKSFPTSRPWMISH
ncbi:MAG: FmdB family zinc ribbon protein [Xanthobacteraceae bacterium]